MKCEYVQIFNFNKRKNGWTADSIFNIPSARVEVEKAICPDRIFNEECCVTEEGASEVGALCGARRRRRRSVRSLSQVPGAGVST